MRLYLEKRVLFGFVFALAIIVGLGIYAYLNNRKFAETSNQVAHTNRVLYHTEFILKQLMDAESRQRGYIITGDTSFLAPFQKTSAEIHDNLNNLIRLTSDNPAQQVRLSRLRPLIESKLSFMEETVDSNSSSFEERRAIISSMRGKQLMDDIKHEVAAIKEEENRLLEQRIQTSEEGFRKFSTTFTGLLTITALILISVFVAINISLLARTKAERDLRRASEDIRDLYDNAPCGYLSVDASGAFVEINNTMLAWIGYSKDEVIGKLNFRDIIPEESLQVFEHSFSEFLQRGKVTNVEYDIVRKDGSVFQIIFSASTIKDEHGKFLKSRSTVFDISDRKKAERQIRQLNQELEAFTYSVSHDLRAPLRSIDGYTKILEEDYSDKLDSEGRRVMNVIMTNAKRMGQLIDDLLEFSRLGRKEIIKTECDMNSIAHDVVHELVESEPQRKVTVEIDELVPSKADPAMIRQVWINLISNAIKYSRKTENPRVEISSYLERGLNVYMIRDNGVGFDMKYIGKLFGVFQRLHKVQEFEGTGVGLAIVYRIIAKHGGKVWAESKVNEGAAFFFSLPERT
jgi:PAS domain S-box-containing protein